VDVKSVPSDNAPYPARLGLELWLGLWCGLGVMSGMGNVQRECPTSCVVNKIPQRLGVTQLAVAAKIRHGSLHRAAVYVERQLVVIVSNFRL